VHEDAKLLGAHSEDVERRPKWRIPSEATVNANQGGHLGVVIPMG
jgi:hypothetical protein